MKKVAILTSGGDAPGLNAAIRSAVLTARYYKLQMVAVHGGFDGLIDGHYKRIDGEQVKNIGSQGGTILKSSRSSRFKTPEGRKQAYEGLKQHGIEAMIILGGDGSFRGVNAFTAEYDIPVIGIPKTIDNDIDGIDNALGFDTALNTVVECIDKLRDTAESHNRIFLVEVMGRESGFIACYAGLASAADEILIPESTSDHHELFKMIKHHRNTQKGSVIAVIAEGDESGGAYKISELLKQNFPGTDIGVCVLGHIQRGGRPSFYDRFLATKLGYLAIEALTEGKQNVMVGFSRSSAVYIPFNDVKKRSLEINPLIQKILNTLSSIG